MTREFTVGGSTSLDLDILETRDVHGLPAIALVDAHAEFELRCRAIALSDTDPFEND
ncbi:MAG TPA: hypothetical protein VHW23_32300 [Kofleriaceae bacterium]|jgi:hypothetical protein|nr:hypothetical protein [Kofleriaceae bacterium]